jgi:hypothetical protein
MNRMILRATTAVVASLALSACSLERSSDPLSPTVAGPLPGVTISPPTIVQPANGAKVVAGQLTFMVANASSSGTRPITYFIEIASDVQFKAIVLAKGGMAAGEGAQTTFRLQDPLVTDATYFWHVRADDGANTSPFSPAAQFTLFTPVIYQPPGPIAPINDQVVSNLHPKFSWTNSSRIGTPDSVSYEVQLSDSNTFTQTASGTVPEHVSGQTSVDSPQDLPVSQQIFWRVRPFDSNQQGPWSAVQSFKTPAKGSGTTGCSFDGPPANATTEQWKQCVFMLIDKRGVGPTVTIEGIWALRPELNAMGADWQNAWRGDPRPRIFLPVPNCPSATNPNAPDCSYSRTVDMGDFGGPWLWIPR